jgi:hypothetical protein
LQLRHLRHLISRFFGVITSRPLSPVEQLSVAASLSSPEATLYWEQHSIDQRHSYTVATRVEATVGENRAAVAAALLHDVGKRHSSIGPIGRSLATLADLTGLPLPSDWRRYRDHGELGAADLVAVDADPLAVAFAADPDEPPIGIDGQVWDALRAADDA